ncbi:hypothetical protein Tco_0928495 [Tanacetum coccineum]
MDYLHTIEAELGINLDIPLSKQDPLDKLIDLANKKRKHADDIHDYFKANKKLKSSVQYGDHLASTVLNDPILGMIMFNSYHRQDVVAIEDLKDFLNTMLYTFESLMFLQIQLFKSLEDWEVYSLQFMQRSLWVTLTSIPGLCLVSFKIPRDQQLLLSNYQRELEKESRALAHLL